MYAVIIGIYSKPSTEEILQLREMRVLSDFIPNTSIYVDSLPEDTDSAGAKAIYFAKQDEIGWPDRGFINKRVVLGNGRILWVVRQF